MWISSTRSHIFQFSIPSLFCHLSWKIKKDRKRKKRKREKEKAKWYLNPVLRRFFTSSLFYDSSEMSSVYKCMKFVGMLTFIAENGITFFVIHIYKATRFRKEENVQMRISFNFRKKIRVSPSAEIRVLWHWQKNGKRHSSHFQFNGHIRWVKKFYFDQP